MTLCGRHVTQLALHKVCKSYECPVRKWDVLSDAASAWYHTGYQRCGLLNGLLHRAPLSSAYTS